MNNNKERFAAVSTALISLNVANNCRQPIGQIKAFVDLILPSLSRYSTAIICQAVERHSSTSPYWPRKFELIELCKEITATQLQAERLRRARLPAPTELPEEQQKINLEGIRMAREAIAAIAAKRGMPNG